MNKLFEWLSKTNPLWFLTAYLVSIPIFGGLYAWAVPHGFVAPYARYEPSVRPDEKSVREIIRRSLIGNTQWKFGNFRNNSVKLGDNIYDLESINVWMLEVSGTTNIKAVLSIKGCCLPVINTNFGTNIEITVNITEGQTIWPGHGQDMPEPPLGTCDFAVFRLSGDGDVVWRDDGTPPLADESLGMPMSVGDLPLEYSGALAAIQFQAVSGEPVQRPGLSPRRRGRASSSVRQAAAGWPCPAYFSVEGHFRKIVARFGSVLALN
jgi:hypothetical protein